MAAKALHLLAKTCFTCCVIAWSLCSLLSLTAACLAPSLRHVACCRWENGAEEQTEQYILLLHDDDACEKVPWGETQMICNA